MSLNKDTLLASIGRLEAYVESNGYKGYEPFDGLSSYLNHLTFGNIFLQRILQQTIRQSPVNLRPVTGVPKKESTKGRGYMASGYLNMYKHTKKDSYKEKADLCLDWLIRNKSPMYETFSWGNHFEYVSRSGKLPYLEPTIVWTSLIGLVFLDAFETFKSEKYLDVAKGITDWILSVPREKTGRGDCLSYVFFGQNSIHNSNMLGAAMLARAGKILQRPDMMQVAKSAMEYSCSRQMKDGSWYYGEAEKNHWVDNFHSGYNLDSLKCYIENTGDEDYRSNIRTGLEYYKKNFFESDGTPRYYNSRKYPLDIQCASQAITTLVYFSDMDEECIEIAKKVAAWTIGNMQDRSGYFYYRIYPLFTAKAPMIHWGQATMYKGLTRLLTYL
jgi:rhamnogalacturonyl hydrolase YesR